MERNCVAVRVRPPVAHDSSAGTFWKVDDNRISLHKPHGTPISGISYAFDHVFDEGCTNSRVYELLTKDIIHAAVEGFHGTAFAYGQTSSGKTFTMNGSETDPGIIHQGVRDVFDRIQMMSHREFLIRVSYMELYNEEINDLFAVENQKLQIHESLECGIFVAGLREEIVSNAEHVLKLRDMICRPQLTHLQNLTTVSHLPTSFYLNPSPTIKFSNGFHPQASKTCRAPPRAARTLRPRGLPIRKGLPEKSSSTNSNSSKKLTRSSSWGNLSCPKILRCVYKKLVSRHSVTTSITGCEKREEESNAGTDKQRSSRESGESDRFSFASGRTQYDLCTRAKKNQQMKPLFRCEMIMIPQLQQTLLNFRNPAI